MSNAPDAGHGIDGFFATFPTFPYRHHESSTIEFYRICNFFRWQQENPLRKQAHEAFKAALVRQFNNEYGTNINDLEAWRRLYVALEIPALPSSVKAAQEVWLFPLVQGWLIIGLCTNFRIADNQGTFHQSRRLNRYPENE